MDPSGTDIWLESEQANVMDIASMDHGNQKMVLDLTPQS
jgi:hypothetical protein